MPAATRMAATCSAGIGAGAQDDGLVPRAIDDGRRRPAVRRSAVQHEVDRVAQLRDDASARPPPRAHRRRSPTSSGAARRPSQGPRRVVGRDPQPDVAASTGQRGRPANIRPLRDDDRQAARPAGGPERRRGRRDQARVRAAWARVVEQQHHGLVRWALLHVEQSLDAAWRAQRHRDAVDRVGGQGDDAATAGAPRRRPPGPPRRPRTTRAVMRTACAVRPLPTPSRRDAASTARWRRRRTSCSIIWAAPSSSSGGAT